VVVPSEAALERAEAPIHNARQRETAAVETPLLHRQAQRFTTPAVAPEALAAWAKRWTSHQGASDRVIEHQHDAGQGRPTPRTPLKASEWPIQAHVRSDDDPIAHHKPVKAGFGLGTPIDVRALSDAEVIAGYQGQAHVEGGVRLLTDPLCFVSSLVIKKPRRIDGLLMVMTLALLVSSVAPRRLRTP
jgi:transposase